MLTLSKNQKPPHTANRRLLSRHSPTFNEVLDGWLGESRARLKPTTFATYSAIADCHLRPALGSRPVGELKNDEILAFLGREAQKYAPATVRGVANVLRAVLDRAVKHGCRVSPHACRCPAASKPRISVFSPAELARLTDALGPAPEGKDLGLLICLSTGLRVGEICALRWGDIDKAASTLSVRRTLSRIRAEGGQGGTVLYLGRPKSAESARQIPLPSRLSALLSKRRGEEGCFVLSGTARPTEPRTMQRHFKAVLEGCGLEYRNFHSLRHTFATRYIDMGFDVKALSMLLGHSDVSITLNTYVHPSFEKLRGIMEQMEG